MSSNGDSNVETRQGERPFSGVEIDGEKYAALPDVATLQRYARVGAEVVLIDNGIRGSRYTWNGVGLVLESIPRLRLRLAKTTAPSAPIAVRRVG